MLDGNIYISSNKSTTKYVILPLELKTVTQIDLVLSGAEITVSKERSAHQKIV